MQHASVSGAWRRTAAKLTSGPQSSQQHSSSPEDRAKVVTNVQTLLVYLPCESEQCFIINTSFYCVGVCMSSKRAY